MKVNQNEFFAVFDKEYLLKLNKIFLILKQYYFAPNNVFVSVQCECCAMLKKYPLMKPDTWQRTKAKEWGNMTGSDKQYWIANRCNSKVGGPNKIKCPCKAFDTGFFG